MLKTVYTLSAIFLLTSCTMAPSLEKPIQIDQPIEFVNSELSKGSVITTNWWREFNDDILNALVDSVISNNLDLKIAGERVKQFESLFDIQSSGQYPSISLKGGYNKHDGKIQLGIPLPSADENGFIDQKTEQYSLKTGLLLNLDIWGKYRAMGKSANAAFRAAKFDLQKAYNGLIAQTVSLYYEIETLKRQKKTLASSVQSFRKGMDLQEKRYKRGTRSRLNLERSKQQHASSEIQFEQVNEGLKSVQYALALLNGKYPTVLLNTSEKNPLQNDLKEIPTGIPSDLLKRRPDVNASSERLESARFNIGVARADQFPQLTLSADLGFIGKDLSDVFKFDFDLLDETYNVGVNQVFYAGGAKSAAIDQKWTEYNTAKLNYQKIVLNAFKEVELSLVSMKSKTNQLSSTENQLNASENTLKIMKKRYRKGISPFDELLNSERAFYNSQNSYFSAQKNYIQARINLYLSLGGNF